MKNQYYTDIQLKALSRWVKVFNMKIIMRRDSGILSSKIPESTTLQGGVFQIDN